MILAVSLLGIGIGQTAIATLGIPYIDDNVKSKQSPLYMAITIGVRVLGPALGYYLGSLCIRQYVDLTMEVDHTDPNFIGAWWLGKFRLLFRKCIGKPRRLRLGGNQIPDKTRQEENLFMLGTAHKRNP